MNLDLSAININPDEINTLDDARDTIRKLMNLVEELIKQNTQLFNKIQEQDKEIARLKQQPQRPTFNASSDHSVTKLLNKKADGTGKKVWEKSHKKETLQVDREMQTEEVAQCTCGSQEFKPLRSREKLVQGIIIARDNVLYQGRDKKCLTCGKVYHAAFPSDTHGLQFSSLTRSWISYFNKYCRMTEPLLHNMLTDIGLRISVGEISHILLINSDKLLSAITHLRTFGIKGSKQLGTDATEHKHKSKTTGQILHHHLQYVGNTLLSLFSICKKYNSTNVGKALTKRGLKIPITSDDHSANGSKLLALVKQLCWIHEIRHYLKLSPKAKVHKDEMVAVIDELLAWYKKAKHYNHDPTTVTDEQKQYYQALKNELEVEFDRIMANRVGYDELNERLKLTKKKRCRLLTFLDYPFMEIHNNRAERDLREAVMIRKISGGTKSDAGDRSLERHLSVIQTAKKQGLNIFETLHGLLTNQISPAVLTAKR